MRKDKEEYNAYMKVYMLERYHSRRNSAIVEFGGKCNKCDSTESLEFDHVDPTTKLFTIGKLWSLNDATYRIELAKCQLLCGKCHVTKTIAEGSLKNRVRDTICECGKQFTTIKAFAGHTRWCNTYGTVAQR